MTLAPLGDSALVLSFGEEVDDAATARVRAVSDALQRAAVPGILDIVPAFATVTVFYDVARSGGYDSFEQRITTIAERAAESSLRALGSRIVEVPLCYGGEFGPDLEAVAAYAGTRLDHVIEWHIAAEYTVHAIGFVPGFAYLGGLPRKLHVPRRSTPRPRVAPGSVGIGGSQTGVYPIATPGGWNLIGRTPLIMFEVGRSRPALLQVGDRVKFRAISPEEFAAWK